MKPEVHTASLSAADLNRLHDEARRDAGTLRGEAIDEFWRGVNAALWGQLSSARRASARLSQRLQQHQRLRGT